MSLGAALAARSKFICKEVVGSVPWWGEAVFLEILH